MDLIDTLATRHRRYASIEEVRGSQVVRGGDADFGLVVGGGTFERVFTVRACPSDVSREWQLVDRDNYGEIWQIEKVQRTRVPGDLMVFCNRAADRYDPTIHSLLTAAVHARGGVVAVFNGAAASWGGR